MLMESGDVVTARKLANSSGRLFSNLSTPYPLPQYL